MKAGILMRTRPAQPCADRPRAASVTDPTRPRAPSVGGPRLDTTCLRELAQLRLRAVFWAAHSGPVAAVRSHCAPARRPTSLGQPSIRKASP